MSRDTLEDFARLFPRAFTKMLLPKANFTMIQRMRPLQSSQNFCKEMAALFPDKEFHIGCDETGVKGPCSLNSTFSFERTVLNSVQNVFGKVPAGWEEVLFDAGAATPETIVHAWSRHSPSDITATGRKAIMSASSHFYFTEAGGEYPAGWSKCWYDISTGVPSSQKSLLLGGEASMWTDTYCITNQCGASPPGTSCGQSPLSSL